MNNDITCDLELVFDEVSDWDFDMEAFEAEMIEDYGNLELALLDMRDRPEEE